MSNSGSPFVNWSISEVSPSPSFSGVALSAFGCQDKCPNNFTLSDEISDCL